MDSVGTIPSQLDFLVFGRQQLSCCPVGELTGSWEWVDESVRCSCPVECKLLGVSGLRLAAVVFELTLWVDLK